MERFVFHMERFAVGHGAFSFLHGAIFHPSWSGRPFNRLDSEMHRLDSQSDRLVFQSDRRDFPLNRRPYCRRPAQPVCSQKSGRRRLRDGSIARNQHAW